MRHPPGPCAICVAIEGAPLPLRPENLEFLINLCVIDTMRMVSAGVDIAIAAKHARKALGSGAAQTHHQMIEHRLPALRDLLYSKR